MIRTFLLVTVGMHINAASGSGSIAFSFECAPQQKTIMLVLLSYSSTRFNALRRERYTYGYIIRHRIVEHNCI